jgi:putative protease
MVSRMLRLACVLLVTANLVLFVAGFGIPPMLATTPWRGKNYVVQGKLRSDACLQRGAAGLSLKDKTGEDHAMRKNPSLYSETAPGVTVAAAKTTGNVFKSFLSNTTQLAKMVKPEVLAPAGGWPQLRAAVQNGADACYFGLSDFNARARASNFDPEEDLPKVMEYLHEHGVKGYVTINVLIFDTELEGLERMVKQVARCGVDAVIVQDVGAVELIKAIAPNLKIHGSTQMSITSTEGARFAQNQGVSRVVLGRELSLREISAVRQGFGHEIEVFVHGALCVSYSGQCFSSEAWGGRSANRGQCAQACRLPYNLVLNGEEQDMGDIKYLLSPQDLMAVELVPALIAAGVTCFKIEGRLKGPEYVALTTQVYRQAVDRAWAEMKDSPESIPESLTGAPFLTKEVSLELAQVFARGQDAEHSGLTPGFLKGSQHQMLVRGRSPRHRGILVGEVTRVLSGDAGVVVRLSGPIKRGDGVVFDRGAPEEREEGGLVYEVRRMGDGGWGCDGMGGEGRGVCVCVVQGCW